MKIRKLLVVTMLVVFASNGSLAQAAIQVLHSFVGGPSDAVLPEGSLIQSGSTLYGSANGGASGAGAVFKLNTDGSGFGLVHSFVGSTEGSNPNTLIESGSTLYGMTTGIGPLGNGTVFKVDTNGSNFGVLHSFAGFPSDGGAPQGALLKSGSSLYGMTLNGGSDGDGTIFNIGTDGTGYGLLRQFAGGNTDGQSPYGSLIQSGSTLYGMTSQGGSNFANQGTVFKMESNGAGFSILHAFVGGISDGTLPLGSLLQSGATLYGMTAAGGSANLGTIFKIDTDGTNFSVLHSFTGGANDGRQPQKASLIQVGTSLYGMTYGGGASDKGTIFQIGTNGSGFSLVHSFAGGAADGRNPFGSLIQSGSTLYGMTAGGGSSDLGTVFSVSVPEPGALALAIMGAVVLIGYRVGATRRIPGRFPGIQ